ncbi:hypothetical protein ACVWZI_002053 [Thermostichus sp. OS-CIW-28]
MITSILEIDLTQTVRYYLDHRDPPPYRLDPGP